MTRTTDEVRPRHLATASPSPTPYLLATGAALAVVAAVALPDSVEARWMVAGLLASTLVFVALRHPVDAVLATTGVLLSLGLLRRLASMVLPDPPDDPFLLIGPSVAVALCAMTVLAGALRVRSPLALLTTAFAVMSLVAALNVRYASFEDNVQGLLFWTVPLLWFPVGRHLFDERERRRLLAVVAVVGAASSATGLYQVLVDLPPWDQRWFEDRGYAALGISGLNTIHPFGWSPSHTEFAQIASIVMVISGLGLVDARRSASSRLAVLSGAALLVSTGALALSAVRTAQMLLVAAVLVLVVASGVVRVRTAVAVVAVGALLVVGGVRVLDAESWSDRGVVGLVRRSLVGIADPFGESSTLGAHASLTRGAFEQLDERPLGSGPSYGTLSRDELQLGAPGAENDLGNGALAFGIPGVLLVVALTVVGLQRTWVAVRRHPTLTSLAVLGVLVLSLRYWWTGSHYATAALVWLLLGSSDRPSSP